jgi:hypothetical protein
MVGRVIRIVMIFVCLLGLNAMVPAAQPLPGGPQALLEAARRGRAEAVSQLIVAKADVNVRDAHGRTPLLIATQGNHVDVARRLIAAGADVNAKDELQDSPFLYAGAEGRVEILKMTLAAGADLKSTNRFGGTALIPACHHGYVDAVKVLLATDIDVNHVNSLGLTALLEAITLGDGGNKHIEIVRQLLEHGAKPNLADKDGVTPLAHATRRGYRDMIALLRKYGAK